MSDYYITDTESEASTQELSDYVEFKAARAGLPEKYWDVTIAWSVPIQRLDGKWVLAFCPYSTATGRTIETDPNDGTWFSLDFNY